jgi:hypothetical protein
MVVFSQVTVHQKADKDLTSRCSLFNRGAPRLASRFRLQYRQIFSMSGNFFLAGTFRTYSVIFFTMIAGTSGGPEL